MHKKMLASVALVATLLSPTAVDAINLVPNVERSNSPEVERAPIPVPEIEQLVPNLLQKRDATPQTQSATATALGQNLVPNPGFEIGITSPASWNHGKWGSNGATFYYPTYGHGGGRGVRVTMSNRVTGDAKWYFNPVPVTPGSYTYMSEYVSSVPTYITVEYHHSDGSVTYEDLAQPPATPLFTWGTTSVTFTIPSTVISMTVFHLINKNGALTTDNISLVKNPGGNSSNNVFNTGAVTIRLDDNWLSQYQNAFPILDSAGLKATLYATSEQIRDNGFIGYMSRAEIEEVYANGHEIGAHTKTHRDLVTLSPAEKDAEIQGSRNDILSWDAGPVRTFAIPFGSYDADVIQRIKNAGFEAAGTSNGGDVTENSDPFQLERRGIENTTTFAQIKQWIDDAIANREWVILLVHEVRDTCTDRYCVSTSIFNQMVNYLETNNIRVVTVSEALDSL